METTIWRQELPLQHRFTTSRDSHRKKFNVFIRLEHEGVIGYGEAAPNLRYAESPESAMQTLRILAAAPLSDPWQYAGHIDEAAGMIKGDFAAKAAFDMALHDWIGQSLGQPLYKIWGLNPADMPVTSMTIGIDEPAIIVEKTRQAREFKALKVKLGTQDDRGIIETLRGVTQQPIRVDVNEGWDDREEAIRQIHWLSDRGVELVEQPMPAARIEDMAWLKARSPLPLLADEAFTAPESMLDLVDGYHGVNIKLMKCGGIQAARRAIILARALGLEIMLGCMIESSLAIAAAAQLAPLVDYADLDGNLLISKDPFIGHPVHNGRIRLGPEPGLGAQPKIKL